MIKNFKELVQELKSQIPIQELISEYTTIKKSGRGFAALCPFHDDHHPSLQIHPQKGIFKCFVCGTGGDLITFYSLINKKKWSEAVTELALKYGLKIEYGTESKTETQIKNKLLEINKTVLELFKRNLLTSHGSDALSYLKTQRKLSDSTINKFELGFAENKWDSILNYLTKDKKYPQELIIASGLFVIREGDGTYYDRFRNRIIFPIYDENNNVLGFGGRTITSDEPKYLNSPDTLIFTKGHTLYGFNFAKDEIKKSDYTILTEGYLDVISAYQSGLINTVASLGTALTLNQARLLSKYTESKKVYLCLDFDEAGKRALESVFRLSQGINQHVKIDFRVSGNLNAKDLDEALKTYEVDTIRYKIVNGDKLINFVLDKYINAYNTISNEINKSNILDELIGITESVNDPIEKKESIKYLSHKLNLEEEIINIKLNQKKKQLKNKFIRTKEKTQSEDDRFKMHSPERYKHAEMELLILYIFSFPHNVKEIRENLSSFIFLDDKNKLIKEYLDSINSQEIKSQEVINQLLIEFNEYKHVMEAITNIAWHMETSYSEENNNYQKIKDSIIKQAQESITWWITNKQKMASLKASLKECKTKEEESKVLQEMMDILKK